MKILITGSIAIDRIMVFNGKFRDVIQPDKLHLLSVSVLLDQLKDTRGGVAANISYSLALLGEKPVLFGSVGKEAKSYMTDLQQLGVDIDHIHFSDLPIATFTVMTDLQNCQIGGFYPGAMSDAAELSIEKFKEDDVFVVISPHDPRQMAKQVEECKKFKKRLFYDVGQQASNILGEDIRAGIEAAELLIVNDYEMGVLIKKTGWSKKQIQDKVHACVVTFGEQGCVIKTPNEPELKVPATQADQVVDPTGAGDAFRAGFLYGYLRDFHIEECAEMGSTAAAFEIEQQGSQAHTFTVNEFFERYYKNYPQRKHGKKSN